MQLLVPIFTVFLLLRGLSGQTDIPHRASMFVVDVNDYVQHCLETESENIDLNGARQILALSIFLSIANGFYFSISVKVR